MYLDARTREQPLAASSAERDSGLAQPPRSGAARDSVEAIEKALKLDPAGGYVLGSTARKRLEEAFRSVPLTAALELHQQLARAEGVLGKLFKLRLHTATRNAMLKVLWGKHLEQQKVLREAEQRVREACELQKEVLQKHGAALRQFESAVEKLCQLKGEDSDDCQRSRFELLEQKFKFDESNRNHRLKCP